MPNSFSFELMDRVLIPNLNKSQTFRILSGFVSGNFLSEIVKLYPEVNFEVYVGMANQGIATEDFYIFRRLANESSVKVFFQESAPVTHIKAYEWKLTDDTVKQMAGSANFSTNGFLLFHELLVETSFDMNLLIKQSGRFVDVLDPEAEKFVGKPVEASEVKGEAHDVQKQVLDFWLEQQTSRTAHSEYVATFKREKQINKFNKAIDVPVLSYSKDRHGVETLESKAGRTRDMELFPLDDTFMVLTDDGYKISMHRQGLFGKLLTSENFELGSYLRKRISLNDDEGITQASLDKYGRSSIKFYATDDDKLFLFDFSKNA